MELLRAELQEQPRVAREGNCLTVCRMARLYQSKNGKFTIKIPRGCNFSEHSLTAAGVELLKKAGVEINGLVPFHLLQLLDRLREVFPLTGAFDGQMQFEETGCLKVTRRAQHESLKKARKLRVISADWEQLMFDSPRPLRRAA